jgi:hypothetical protein
MRKLVLIALAIFMSQIIKAQLIDNKINIYVGYHQGSFIGKEMINEGSFIFPALYSNYSSLSGFSIKALIKKDNFLSMGLGIGNTKASGWKNQNSVVYSNSSINQYSFSPTLQIHNRYKETGILNRIRVLSEIAPNLGVLELSLVEPLFDIPVLHGTVAQPMRSREFFYGLRGTISMELVVTRWLGIYFLYSLEHNQIESLLYHDKKFTSSYIGFGSVIRLNNNKRFYY